MTLLEAKSYGLPIVSFDCLTGPSDIIRNDFNGYLVEENNVEEMICKINKVLKNRNKLNEFSVNSKVDIDKFKIETILNKWRRVLEDI